MRESDRRIDTDRLMVEIRALEWVRGRTQGLVINKVTKDWPAYNR